MERYFGPPPRSPTVLPRLQLPEPFIPHCSSSKQEGAPPSSYSETWTSCLSFLPSRSRISTRKFEDVLGKWCHRVQVEGKGRETWNYGGRLESEKGSENRSRIRSGCSRIQSDFGNRYVWLSLCLRYHAEIVRSLSENTWPGKVMYSFTLPHKAFAAGDTIPVAVKFSPLAKGVRIVSLLTTIREHT